MIEDIEEAVRSDVETGWPGARIVDRRANVGFSEGKTTSHTFRIHTADEKFELTIGPRAVRSDDAGGVVRALRDQGWIDRIRQEGRLLVEKDNGEFGLGPRPDSIVL